jgi:FkbM family methyltransferase
MKKGRELVRDGAYTALRLGLDLPLESASTLLEVIRLRRCLTDLRINCVLDVGANEGQFATRLRRLGYRGQIYSFEPNPQAFQRMLALHGSDHQWRGFPIALGSVEQTKPFYVHAESSLSSFLRPVEASKVVEVRDIEVRRLDMILDSLTAGNAESQILLKMDTQGWDIEVAKGAGAALARVVALLSELSVQALYDGMTPYYEALAFYAREGFVLYDVTPINRGADRTIIECDCLMIRRTPRLFTESTPSHARPS